MDYPSGVSAPRSEAQPLILFDGECNLCSGAVQFVIRRDPRARFRFAALQSEVGRQLLAQQGIGAMPESVVLLVDGRLRMRSAAALGIARRLRWPWPLCAVFWLVPRPLRDWCYDFVARRRFRWFGRRESCWLPTPELRARFVDVAAAPPTGTSC